jgi:hypothetical protein
MMGRRQLCSSVKELLETLKVFYNMLGLVGFHENWKE